MERITGYVRLKYQRPIYACTGHQFAMSINFVATIPVLKRQVQAKCFTRCPFVNVKYASMAIVILDNFLQF
jgi:hypothetical protein